MTVNMSLFITPVTLCDPFKTYNADIFMLPHRLIFEPKTIALNIIYFTTIF